LAGAIPSSSGSTSSSPSWHDYGTDVPGGWYASGGIFNRPTIVGVGEGGESEAVAPISKLQAYIKDAVREAGVNSNGNITITVPVTLDGRTIATVIAPYSDRVQGQNLNLAGRGLGI
jgi:hypothetical protein